MASEPYLKTFNGTIPTFSHIAPDTKELNELLSIYHAAQPIPLARELGGHHGTINHVVFSRDSAICASSALDNAIVLWNLKTGTNSKALHHPARIAGLAFTQDASLLASWGNDKAIRLWTTGAGELLETLEITHNATCAAFDTNDRTLAVGLLDGSIVLWNIIEKKHCCLKTASKDSVRAILYSRNSACIIARYDGFTIRLWDISKKESSVSLKHEADIVGMALSPDEKLLASWTLNKKIYLWNLTTGKLLYRLDGFTEPIKQVVFGATGNALASYSNEKIVRFWDIESGKEICSWPTPTWTSVTFSSDGTKLACLADDKRVHVYALETMRELYTLDGHPGDVCTFAFNPSKHKIASFTYGLRTNSSIYLWRLRRNLTVPQYLLALKAARCPTYEECFRPELAALAKTLPPDLQTLVYGRMPELNEH